MTTTDKEEVNASIARVDHYRKLVSGERSGSADYRGIPIFAYKGLHAHALEFLKGRGLIAQGTRVLELGCGAGAMSQRLADAGADVVAVDAVPENFKASGPTVRNRGADLNHDFVPAVGQGYDVVVAMEIIEHLESPRAFLRSCFQCVKPGGRFLLTTPNVDSSFAIATLILKGDFTRFDDEFLLNDGHIMPIGRHQFLAAAKDAGFVLEAEATFGSDESKLAEWPKFWALHNIIRKARGNPGGEGAIAEYLFVRPA